MTAPTPDPAGTVHPVPGVRAVQLTDDADWEAIAAWCGGTVEQRRDATDEYYGWLEIPRADGYPPMEAFEGDWVVRDDTSTWVLTEHMWQTEYPEVRTS